MYKDGTNPNVDKGISDLGKNPTISSRQINQKISQDFGANPNKTVKSKGSMPETIWTGPHVYKIQFYGAKKPSIICLNQIVGNI